jgi:membrane protease YdiL (CAAX protease family)
MVLGPSVSGILMTALGGGRAGLRELGSRLLRWRVGARWYAVALLAAPLVMLAVLLALSLTSSAFLPGLFVVRDKAPRVLFGLFAAVTAGVFEEVGWTGFAIPHLRRRYSVLATGLIVGICWAAWHLLVAYWASGAVSGPLSLPSYLLDPFLFLVGFRVLMVWVYDRTGSLLVAMLMHAGLTASTLILGAVSLVGGPLMTFDLVWAAAVWLVVAAVAAANAGQLARQPVPGVPGHPA